jgi:3-deoxy-D-manno-octulosonic-acid transferase
VFVLYNLLMTLLSPIWVPLMLLKARKRKEQPNWAERQGNYALQPGPERIWIHAVSVGEVVAVRPVLKELRGLLPEVEIVLSVTTSTGHETARNTAADLYDHLVYFPIDVPRFMLSAMQRVQPRVVAVMETELWMNYLWAAKSFDARTMLINGRISDRSYPRARLFRFFYRRLLAMVDRCSMQTPSDAERITFLGAAHVEVLGNCKFDQAAEGLDADPDKWRSELGIPADAQVVVVGSTRGEAEEQFVLEALASLPADVWIVHAPRHLEGVPDLAVRAGEKLGSAALRSRGETGRYLILDTYGELAQVYTVADVVVIGGGFSNLGGQNLIQPLALGKPVLHGPHMQNFRDAADMAQKAGASRICATPGELADAINQILTDEDLRRRMGAAARQLVSENLGASKRYAEAIAGEVSFRAVSR